MARTGETLFRVRGKYLKYVGILSVVIAFFHGAMGPFYSDRANLAWYYIWAVAMLAYMANRYLRHFTKTYDNIT